MKRRTFLRGMSIVTALTAFGTAVSTRSIARNSSGQIMIEPLIKTHKKWRELLTSEAYSILFEDHTEKPGSSELNHEHREGTFICAACYLPLFESQYKYDSGTGWPSFTQPIPGHVSTKPDIKMIFLRTEYHCARCGGHQGHVFNDGPPPRGERWCNNGLALKFVLKTDHLPALRE